MISSLTGPSGCCPASWPVGRTWPPLAPPASSSPRWPRANPWCGPWSEVTPRSPTSSRQQHVSGRSSSKTSGFNMGGSRTLWAHRALAQGAPEPQRELVKLQKNAWKQHGTGYRWSLGSTRNGGSGECATTDRSPTTSCTTTWCTPPTTPDSGFGASPGGAPGCCDGMGRRCHQALSGHQATRCRPAGRRLLSPRPS